MSFIEYFQHSLKSSIVNFLKDKPWLSSLVIILHPQKRNLACLILEKFGETLKKNMQKPYDYLWRHTLPDFEEKICHVCSRYKMYLFWNLTRIHPIGTWNLIYSPVDMPKTNSNWMKISKKQKKIRKKKKPKFITGKYSIPSKSNFSKQSQGFADGWGWKRKCRIMKPNPRVRRIIIGPAFLFPNKKSSCPLHSSSVKDVFFLFLWFCLSLILSSSLLNLTGHNSSW